MALREEMTFKAQERTLFLQKLEYEVEGAKLDNEIKNIEKNIKKEILNKVLTQNEIRL